MEKVVALIRDQNCVGTYPHIMSDPYSVANKNETILSIRIVILIIKNNYPYHIIVSK